MTKPVVRCRYRNSLQRCQASVSSLRIGWLPCMRGGCKWIYTRTFQTLWLIWVKFSVGNLHILLLSICEFCENDCSGKLYFTEGCKWTFALLSICIFDIFYQISVKFSVTDVYLLLLISCKLYENGLSKSHTLLRGINEFLSILFAFIVQFHLNLV